MYGAVGAPARRTATRRARVRRRALRAAGRVFHAASLSAPGRAHILSSRCIVSVRPYQQ